MKKLCKKIYSKPFVRNVLIMASGTLAAQIIIMILSPVITRIYGPDQYGVLNVFLSIVAIVGPISALTYPIAIVLPSNSFKAKKIINLSVYISLLISILTTVILYLWKTEIIALLNIEVLEPFIYLLPLIVLFSALLQIQENWLIRTKQFSITARVSFIQALVIQGSMVVVGLLYPKASVLILLSVFGIALKAIMMLVFNKVPINKTPLSSLNDNQNQEQTFLRVANEYKDFPLYRAPEVFLNAISQSLPIILLTTFFGPASVGFYSIGRTVLSLPSQLIGKAIGDVFYPQITEAANNKRKITPLIVKTTLAMSGIGLIPFSIIIFFGPQLFSFVFGTEWLRAGEYGRWMAIWLYAMFINQPSVKALPVLSAQILHLKYTLFMLLIRAIALVIGYFIFASDLIAIILFSIVGAILNLGLIMITIRLSKNFDNTDR